MPSKNTKKKMAQILKAKKSEASVKGSGVYRKGVRGNGGYFDSTLGGLANVGKSLIGVPLGVASDLGRAMGMGKYKVRGSGAYSVPWKVVGNSLMTNGSVPIVHEVGDSGLRIIHHEYLRPVYSTTSFTTFNLNLNPGLDTVFPWLSAIAANFSRYRFDGMLLTFKPTISDGVSSFASLGNVIMTANLNCDADTPWSQIQMEQTQFCASAKPSDEMVMPIECARNGSGPTTNSLLIRTGALTTANAQSVVNYDHAVVTVATVGQPSAGVMLGQLYISYDVVLFNPVYLGAGATANSCHYTSTGANNVNHFFGSAASAIVKKYDNVGVTFTATAQKMTLPVGCAGVWCLKVTHVGSSNTCQDHAVTLTNATTPAILNNGSTGHYACPLGVASSNTILIHYFKITDSTVETTIDVASSGLPSSITGTDILLFQLTPNAT